MAESQALAITAGETSPGKMESDGGAYRWEVEFSRFFNYPPMTSTCPDLVPLPSKVRNRRPAGTWISSSPSSHALLQLLRQPSNSDAHVILLVCFRDSILEEHYVSKLNFTWPQVSCISGFPARGTRAVFASYRDVAGKVQKFALRFSTLHETEKFMSALKEILKDTRENGLVASGFVSEISSQSEFMSTDRALHRAYEDFSITNHSQDYTPELPSSNKNTEQDSCTQEIVHPFYPKSMEMTPPCNFDNLLAALPPSFTALIGNCSSDAEQIEAQPFMSQEVNIKSQITKYIGDSSFQDMLVKVEKVIHEMGGDLAL